MQISFQGGTAANEEGSSGLETIVELSAAIVSEEAAVSETQQCSQRKEQQLHWRHFHHSLVVI